MVVRSGKLNLWIFSQSFARLKTVSLRTVPVPSSQQESALFWIWW